MASPSRLPVRAEEARSRKLARLQSAAHGLRLFDLPGLGALGLYVVLSIALFGRLLVHRLSSLHVGIGSDPALMMWFLVWWPHAIASGLNPFLARAVWAPHGLNVTWQTGIPLAAAFASPITSKLGPVAAFNVLCLLSPVLDAWAAFVLCRHLSRSWWAALLGGYLYGFSAFVLDGLRFGHLHLTLVFCAPLLAYFAARRLAEEISELGFVLLLTPLLIAQFLLSTEIFATMTMFGALALLLGWSFSPSEPARRIIMLLRPVACAYALTLMLVSPYLYSFFAFDFRRTPLWSPWLFSADALNLIVPTPTMEVGRIALLRRISEAFQGKAIVESGAYLGIPLIVIARLYCRRATSFSKLLGYLALIAAILALGPFLRLGGRLFPIGLPWYPLSNLPVLDNVLPIRWAMYAILTLALIASLWLAAADIRPAYKVAVALVAIVFNLPNTAAGFWVSAVDTPAFFRTSIYRSYLKQGETVVIMPYGYNGNSLLWQAETGMYFAMAEGGFGAQPEEFRQWPIVAAFHAQTFVPAALEQLTAFLASHDVSAIIVADDDEPTWRMLLARLDTEPVEIGGIWIYKLNLPPAPDAHMTLRQMSSRFDLERFAALVSVAQTYLANGESPASLSVVHAVQLGLIPRDSLIGPPARIDLSAHRGLNVIIDPHRAYGLWLAPSPDGRVEVGIDVWYPAAAPLIEKLRGVTDRISFPDPSRPLDVASSPAEQYGMLSASFSREQLKEAAALFTPLLARESSGGADGAPAQ